MKKLINSKNLLSIVSAVAIFTLSPRFVFAAAPPNLPEIIPIFIRIMSYIPPVVGFVAVAMIVYAGYMWMIAAGDPQKMKTAQGTITWAVIGLVFMFIFNYIIEAVIDFLGVTI